jgi:hypothetical protein
MDAMNSTSLTRGTARSVRNLATWAVALTFLCTNSFASAQQSGGCSAEVWLINTRCAPTCAPVQPDDPRISYWTLGEGDQWLPNDRAAFLASSRAEMPTIFFVHGNWVDPQEAVDHGWQVRHHLNRQGDGRPFRLVIWSWPSQRTDRRPLEDIRIKAAWSDVQSYYLAGLVGQIPQEVPVALVGYSFGSRAITGSLQMLAGGQVAGMSLPQPSPSPRPRLRAVLLGAAMDSDWLLPDHRNGEALPQVEQMLITCNTADAVLKRYHWLYRGCYAQALGYAGPACPAQLGPQQEKLEVVGVSCWVGKTHDFTLYINAAPVCSRLGWYCFLVETERPTATATPSAAQSVASRE